MFASFQGRGGLGAIYTFAAGNGGMNRDSCAYSGYVNSIYTIAISGVNEDGSKPMYAEECPGIMATTYSRDTLRELGVVVSRIVYLDMDHAWSVLFTLVIIFHITFTCFLIQSCGMPSQKGNFPEENSDYLSITEEGTYEFECSHAF